MPVADDKLQQAARMLEQGNAPAATAMLLRLLPKNQADVPLLAMLSLAARVQGNLDQAEYYTRRALRVQPNNSDLWGNLGILQMNRVGVKGSGREEAMRSFRKALEINPANSNARVGIVNHLLDQRLLVEAQQLCEEAGASGISGQLAVSYSVVLICQGKNQEADRVLHRAWVEQPDDHTIAIAYASLAPTLTHGTPREIASRHRAAGSVIERHFPPFGVAPPGPADAERRLRVGLLSPDLRQHSVAFFIEPFFELHDRAQFEVAAYYTSVAEDDTTRRLRSHAALWRNVTQQIDFEAARQIQKDGVDILIDLAGLSSGQRLPILAHKPAPVIVTYCGYPDTTGLSRVDWRIVDSNTDPSGPAPFAGDPSFDERTTERLWRLNPCFLCYRPPQDAPPVTTRDAAGAPVFGSFNNARKVTPETIAAWARIVRRCPGSRFVIKSPDPGNPASADRIRDGFAREGVGDHLDVLMPPKPMVEHLAQYGLLDVALDPFPYHGTTTTCEAAYMGVPTVTIEGRTHAGRVGVTLLRNMGLPDLIARDENDYVEKAVALAGDRARLSRLRSSLRQMLLVSPLCDRAAFVARFGGALREVWRKACGAESAAGAS